MKSIETEARTTEEAIHKACEELGVSREDLEVEVLSNGSSGFLGLGVKNARIRATVKEQSAPPISEALPLRALSDPQVAETAKKTLQDILRLLEVEAAVDLKEDSERILLNIKGDGSGLLIGRKGQTLDALEYLINKIVHKDAEDKKRIVVDTEKEALEAGNSWWDGELFSGMPDWDKLMSYPAPELSIEEQAFLDGPCEELCRMLDDWDISHERGDMPAEAWAFIKKHKFFAMIIPKQYGGLEFSAYANAMVIAKLASRNSTASSTVFRLRMSRTVLSTSLSRTLAVSSG